MIARALLQACRVGLVASLLLISGIGRGAIAAPSTQDDAIMIGYGQTIEGDITADTPVQTYSFDARANDVVTLAMNVTGGDLDPFITLLDAQNVQLATDDNSGGNGNARLAFVIPTTGRYLAQVSHAGGMLPVSGGRYTLTLSAVGEGGVVVERTPLPEPSPTPEATETEPISSDAQGMTLRLQAISPNAPIEDELTRQVAFRLYWFKVAERAQVTISASGTESFAPLLTLYDASFAEINRAQPGELTLTAVLGDAGVYLIGVSLPEAGSTGGPYTIELTGSGAITETDLTPDQEAAPPLPEDFRTLPAITVGQSVEGMLDNTRFMDLYRFLGAAGQTITVEMTSLNPDAINGLDPFLVLLDDARIPLEEHDDIVAGVERDARLVYTLPRTAHYAIVATRFDQADGTSAGPYQLTLRTAAGDGESTAAAPLLESEPLQPNTPIQATFDGAPDVYRFEAQAGELIDLSVTADTGVDPVLILATDALDEVVSSGTGTLTSLRTPAAGSYFLIVATRFGPVGPTGGYILALNQPDVPLPSSAADSGQAAEPAVEAAALSYGQTVSGVIDDATPGRIYTLYGTAGDHVRLSLRAAQDSTLDPYLELRDADGTILASSDDIDPGVIRDSLIVHTLPADAEYQVVVSRYVGPDTETTSGAYELSAERITDDEAAGAAAEPAPALANTDITPLRYGQTQVGEITNEQYLLFYVFTGAAGDVVTIEVDQLSGNLDAILHLYQAAGESWTQIAYNDDSPTGGTYDPLLSDITLPASGPYLVAVGRYGLDKETDMVGTFAITVSRQP